MTDRISKRQRSANMSAIRAFGTRPELIVRKILSANGFRYRLHRHDLPGCPDIVFPGKKRLILVHGCFWHQHSSPACRLAHRPLSNRRYWAPKFRRTIARDKRNSRLQRALGWRRLVVWECQLTRGGLEQRLIRFLSAETHKISSR